MTYAELQTEHKEWLAARFPDQPVEVPAAGMVEEAGELLHAVLALERERIWGKDPRYPHLLLDLEDAVGDCAVYCCSFCNSAGWKFADFMAGDSPLKYPVKLLDLALELVEAGASFNRYGFEAPWMLEYLRKLKAVCRCMRLDLAKVTQRVWVKVRDRKPQPKRVCLCGSTRFEREFVAAAHEETLDGNIVMTVHCFKSDGCCKTAAAHQHLDELHKRKLDLADEVRVVSERLYCIHCTPSTLLAEGTCPRCFWVGGKAGQYIGDSTRSEIAYATAHSKEVRYGRR